MAGIGFGRRGIPVANLGPFDVGGPGFQGAGRGPAGEPGPPGAPPAGGEKPVGEKEIARAAETLRKYKQGRQNLEQRIVEDELWWELRHWETLRKGKRAVRGPEPSSAWLFNAILNKHADAMDNYPEPVVLPRERSDEASARALSSVLPVVLENCGFEQTYSDNWWEKLKHGTAAYGVFWNNRKENGLGDVDVRKIDLLKLFWEPGITDLQESGNLFLAELMDDEALNRQYPEFGGALGGSVIDVKEYLYDDTVDTTGKSVVVDWYYKTRSAEGRTALHYAKFVGDTLLFASENEPAYQETGWYGDGKYPFVLDVLFPEKGTPAGFGYVAICKDPQLYIDKLSGNILESSMMGTKKRFFASENTNINEAEFLDWTKPIVHVAGALDGTHLQEIAVRPLDAIYFNVLQAKIEEMKDTAANRDVNSGGTGSGVTAAAAIAALQEAGNKASRDMIAASYRAYTEINKLVIERMRQFYDEARAFRITGQTGGYEFLELDNSALKPQFAGFDQAGGGIYREPVFDLKLRAQRKNPFSRMEQNERAKELFGMGFFNPDRAQEALVALEMMEFEGIDKVREQVRQGQTLLNICQQQQAQIDQLIGAYQLQPGTGMAPPAPRQEAGRGAPGGGAAPRTQEGAESVSGAVMQARTPMTGYGEQLARRSRPSVE